MTDATQRLGEEQYVELTTFRRNGAAVPTPVWIAPDGDRLVVVSVDETGKTTRLAHTARVELRACSVRGTVAQDAARYAGRASVHRDAASIASAKKALGAKYGWWYRALTTVEPLIKRLPGRRARAAIVITDVSLLAS
jgi:PPOX class probable F420-dependent enzyme